MARDYKGKELIGQPLIFPVALAQQSQKKFRLKANGAIALTRPRIMRILIADSLRQVVYLLYAKLY